MIDSKSVQKPPFRMKRSFSVNSMMSSSSLSRSAGNELQQKLNKRLSKEMDPEALEKFESAVQQNMSHSRAISETKQTSVS